jgi:hypothetical protein
MTSRLGSVKTGQLSRPPRSLFYGSEGVGKSTLAADAPSPIFLDIECGSERIDVARYPFEEPKTFAAVKLAIDDLVMSNHEYKTIVIDTVDSLEALLWRHVCDEHKQESIESFGYGKGYQVAVDAWRSLLASLDRLRDKGMKIVLLGHAAVKMFKNPLGDDFDRYQLRIHEKAAGLVKEWCDVVGFVRFDEGAGKRNGDKRARGWSTGKRIVHLERGPAWDAKSRLCLPAELELDAAHPWAPFETAIVVSEATAPMLLAEVEAHLKRLGEKFYLGEAEKLAVNVRAAVIKADRSTLSRILASLRDATTERIADAT